MSGASGGLDADYAALRHGVGAYVLPRDVVAVRGRDAASYLQGQLSQDVAGLRIGDSAPSLLLEPDGKLAALVRVTATGADAYALDTDAGYAERVVDRLRRFRLRSKVELETLDWPCVALRGEGVAPAAGPSAGPPFTLGVDWQGTRGVDLLGPGALDALPAEAHWCGHDAWEALRVEAGIPAMGSELDDKTIAAEAGLVARTVSFAKGCYTGQELVARLDARGNRVARRLCGLVVEGAGPTTAGALVGAAITVEGRDKPLGAPTSAAWCPGLGALGALCYLHRSVEVPAAVVCEAQTGPAKRWRAEARALPLVGS